MNTQQSIIDNNKLIAEFMGFTKCIIRNEKGIPYDYNIPNGFELIKEVQTTIESEWCEVLEYQDYCMSSDLKFHTSFDWLMPVVEKISLIPDGDGYKFKRSLDNGLFIGILNIYDYVVEFIKWWFSTNQK